MRYISKTSSKLKHKSLCRPFKEDRPALPISKPLLDRKREGHRQSDEHWKCFISNVGETSERRGGARMDFSERIDTILN